MMMLKNWNRFKVTCFKNKWLTAELSKYKPPGRAMKWNKINWKVKHRSVQSKQSTHYTSISSKSSLPDAQWASRRKRKVAVCTKHKESCRVLERCGTDKQEKTNYSGGMWRPNIWKTTFDLGHCWQQLHDKCRLVQRHVACLGASKHIDKIIPQRRTVRLVFVLCWI